MREKEEVSMDTPDLSAALTLPRRARVAFALAAARRAFPAGPNHGATWARQHLQHGWRWILRPHYSWEHVNRSALAIVSELLARGPRSSTHGEVAVLSALYAVLYCCGQAIDVPEIQDWYPAMVLEPHVSARQAVEDPAAEAAWQQRTLEWLVREHSGPTKSLGSVLTPGDFGFPEENLNAATEAERSKKEDVAPIQPQDLVEGVVTALLEDRAVIQLLGRKEFDSLAYLYTPEISDPPPSRPADVLKKGQRLRLRILKPASYPLLTLRGIEDSTAG
jgi:hypothetical protein